MTAYELVGIDGDPISIDEAAESWRFGDPPELRTPTADEVKEGAGGLSEDDARRLVELLAHYPAFVPTIDDDRRDSLLLELLASSTEDVVPWELSLTLEADGPDRIRRFLERALSVGLQATHRDRLIPLLSFLVEHPDARPIAIAVMAAASRTDEAARSITEQLALERTVEWP